ncbi:hypothetical protein CHS0354_020199 [Potamilus streckersoni]|uniref:G-protein coupled receptors family 1 profile domain-containing protein n=1 Tax=Potamilus streckersoni TaxID=2493646 RepID=A0AAE0SJY6_9BIVA|nr:hypothetical protein CHS0354_020199 [Potamilus streckersoni]
MYNTPQICAVKSFFQNATVTAISSGLLLIAVDRFLKVRWPLGRQITPSCARILTIVFFLGACIVASPVANLSGEHKSVKNVNGINVNITQCEEKSQYKKSTWIGITLIQRKKATHSLSCKSNNEVRQNRAVYNIHQHYLFLEKNHQEAGVAETSFSTTNDTIERSSAATDIPKDNHLKYAVRKNCASRDEKSLYMKRTTWKRKMLRQTLITFIVTIIFVSTVVIYQVYLLKLRDSYTYLQELDNHGAVTFLISYSLFFINCVINPFLYGFLDRRFQKIIKQSGLRMTGSLRKLRRRIIRK